jgi:hypothetical protein
MHKEVSVSQFLRANSRAPGAKPPPRPSPPPPAASAADWREPSIDISNPRRGKQIMLTGFGIVCLGVLMIASAPPEMDGAVGFSALVIVAGFVVGFIGRCIHWYQWK